VFCHKEIVSSSALIQSSPSKHSMSSSRIGAGMFFSSKQIKSYSFGHFFGQVFESFFAFLYRSVAATHFCFRAISSFFSSFFLSFQFVFPFGVDPVSWTL